MKKLYTTQNLRDLSFSRSHHRSSLFKVASLGTAVALFLSNASPVFSANLDLTKASLENVKNAAVVYPQSTLSAYNDYTSGMGGDNSTINVLTVDGRSVWKDAQNIFTVGGAVILDPEEYTEKGKSVAIDSTAHALGLGNIAIDAGYNNQDDNRDAFVNAYSLRVRADGDETVAIGSGPETRAYGKVILGDGSGTVSGFGMAGYDPFTKGLSGDDSHVWVGNAGIATIGNDKEKMARQLEGVAAGTYNTDAVNVAQLKSLQKYVDQGWSLSVGGENAKAVGIKDTVDLSAASGNLTIIKGEEDNNVKFDLAENIKVERVTAGRSSISDDGILFANGAGITVDGIDAGNKKITGVAAGEEPEDAVNFAQLGKIENTVEGVTHNISQYFGGGADVFNGKAPSYTIQGKPHNGFESTFNAVDTSITNIQNQIANVAKNSLVKQEENESAITIGESTGGTEINVANKSGENRIISGVKAAVNANDAVNKEQLDGRIADISNSINNIEEGSAFAVLYDKKADGAVNYNSVSLGGDKTTAPVALRNVKDGKIIENSHDAINGSQLWKTNDRVAGAEKDIIHINDKVTNISATVTDLGEEVFNIQKVGAFAVLYDKKADGAVNYNSVSLGGDKTTAPVALRNVKDGKIIENSHDAINGSQLWKTNDRVAGAEKDIIHINDKVTNISATVTDLGEEVFNIQKVGAFAVLYDKKADGAVNYNSVSLGGDKTTAPVALRNVKDGKIIENSHDAINGSQLWKTNDRVAGAEKDIIHINDKVTNISATVTDLGEEVFNIQKVGAFAVLYDKKADGAVNYNSVSLGGDKTTAPVALHNVKDGMIAQGSHDAINGSQIEKISRDVAVIFGGDAEFSEGILFGPHYHLSQISEDGVAITKDHNNVGDALTGLDDNINNVNSRLTHVANEFTQKIDGVSKDSLLWSNNEQAFVAQHGADKENSKIKFLANGDISANSTDAVNGSQLFVTNQNVTTVTNNLAKISQNTSQYFGGGADVSNGKAPTYTIQGKPHNGFESTFNAVDASITNIQNQITNATKNSLVKQEENEGTITIGKATGGIEINVANNAGNDRTISGVKAAVNANEAVNKAQLDKSIEMISNDINLTSAAAVLYDKENGAINYGSVTLGGVDNQDPVALHNVKDGIIAQGSHDAINGNQINKISGDIANYFGGGASFKNGTFKGPKYSLSVIDTDGQMAKANYYDVGSALTGLDANVKSVNTHLTNVVNDVNEKITNITQEVKGDALLWNGDEQAIVAQL